MREDKLTQPEVEALEFQTNQLYKALKRAISTKRDLDILWTKGLESELHSSLKITTGADRYWDWNRGTPESDLFDRYVLQKRLIGAAATYLEYLKERVMETDVTKNKIIAAIDNKKIPYGELYSMARDLAWAGKFGIVLQALDYVRKHYQKPQGRS